MEELVPGLKVTNIEKLEEDKLREQEMLRQEILREKANKEAQIENRKIGILTEVGIKLSKGIPVSITDEMRDLCIDEKVWAMIMKAEFVYKINKYLIDEDDYDDDTPNYL